MLGYTTIGVSDLEKAKAFYLSLFESQGAEIKIDAGRIVFLGNKKGQAMLAICDPYDKQAPTSGNGVMLAFPVAEKAEADALYARALELGATCDGPPGQRVPDRFYGAYVRDADNNKLCFFKFA